MFGGVLEAATRLEPQPLDPLFPVAREDLVMPFRTYWRGSEAETSRQETGLGPAIPRPQLPCVPSSGSAEALTQEPRANLGRIPEPRAGLGSLVQRDCACTVGPAPLLVLAVYVVFVLFFVCKK